MDPLVSWLACTVATLAVLLVVFVLGTPTPQNSRLRYLYLHSCKRYLYRPVPFVGVVCCRYCPRRYVWDNVHKRFRRFRRHPAWWPL